MRISDWSADVCSSDLLRVMFDTRVTLQQQVSAQIETHFGDKVFKAIVPRNVRLAEAPSHGLPGIVYDKSSRGAKAYIEFGNEHISRVKKEALGQQARHSSKKKQIGRASGRDGGCQEVELQVGAVTLKK